MAMLVEAYLKRGRYRPLAAGIDFDSDDEGGRELGTEAIDFDIVNSAIRANNNSGLSNSTRQMSGYLKYVPVKPKGFKDDEHYSRRWFEAYGPHDEGTKE
ncbi:MAG: hypothetical protein ACU0CA_05170 [Paracoccaceae bacterium]